MLEEGGAFIDTGTCPLPVLKHERRTMPVFCPWCGDIYRIVRLEVERFRKISPVHVICGRCMDFVREGSTSAPEARL